MIMLVEYREIKPSIISSIFTTLVFSPQHGNIPVGEVEMTLGITTQKKATKRLGWLAMRISNKKADLNKDNNLDREDTYEIEQTNIA